MPLPISGYPATYQQYYPQFPQFQNTFPQNNVQIQQNQQPQQDQKAINGFDWVLGQEAAKSYIVPAGKTFILFDASPNANYFWLKSADFTGKPSPAIMFDYTEHQEAPAKEAAKPVVDLSGCVKKDDFDLLRRELDELKKRPEPEHLTVDDVRDLFDQLMEARFAQLSSPGHEAKARKKEA